MAPSKNLGAAPKRIIAKPAAQPKKIRALGAASKKGATRAVMGGQVRRSLPTKPGPK